MRGVVVLLVAMALGIAAGGSEAEGAGADGPAASSATPRASIGGRATGADIVSDDFARGDLGSDWTVHLGSPGIVGGSALGLRSGTFALLSWAAVFPADQFSEAQISADADKVDKGVFVRRRTSDGARYQFHYDTNGTDDDPRPQWQIKYDGVPTPQTRILARNFSAPAPVPGDVLRIEAHGPEIRGYVNRRLILSLRDTALSGGTVGVALLELGGVNAPTAVFARWAGGSLPRILDLRRSGPFVLRPTRQSTCFSIRFASNTRSRHAFTVTNARKKVVWKEVGVQEAGRPTVVRWCGRGGATGPSQGKALPPGRYRASLEASAAPAAPLLALTLTPFLTRTWSLELRT